MRALVIVPAFNEAGAIAQTVRHIFKANAGIDIIVIDDGSSDQTASIAKDSGAHVISLAVNLGIGGAVQTGLQYAQNHDYDLAFQIDGDGQHDPQYLASLMMPVMNDKIDLVVGSRFKEINQGFQSTFTRRVGIRFFVSLINGLTGLSLTDPTSGFRCYGRRAIELFSHYYPTDFPEPEALVIAYRHGLKIYEVPVVMKERQAGASSIGKLKSGYYMLKVALAVLLAMLKKRVR